MDILNEIKRDSNQYSTYSTKDYYIASFLKAKGFKLMATDKKGKDIYFIFEGKEKIENILPGFYNGTEKVIAIDLIGAIRNIKSMLHNI
ncbi:MAG: DUF5659 domain-containing protein [Actinobacteria bacterium]|nr:DUF5659 domain-containing protein [Actinomycetota bacterium]